MDGGLGGIFHPDPVMVMIVYAAINPFQPASQHIADPVDAVNGLIDKYAAAFPVPGAFPVTAFIIGIRAGPGEDGTGA